MECLTIQQFFATVRPPIFILSVFHLFYIYFLFPSWSSSISKIRMQKRKEEQKMQKEKELYFIMTSILSGNAWGQQLKSDLAIWKNPVWLRVLLEYYIQGWNGVIRFFFLHWSRWYERLLNAISYFFWNERKKRFLTRCKICILNKLSSFVHVSSFLIAFYFQDHFTCYLFFFAYEFWFN